MKKVKIITDSCADITKELLDKYDIDYARMNTVLDGKTTPASLSWEYYSAHELYQSIRDGNRVTTTQVPVDEFNRIFELYLEQGYDIVYVGCSLKQSGSVNIACVVAEKMKENYPDAEIYCINSLNSSTGEGMLAIMASELAAKGMSAKEIAEMVTAKRNTVHEFVTVQTLDYLHRSGRVKGSAAFFGNLFGVKPIIISDADGYQTPIKKVKGRVNSIKESIRLLKEESFDNGQPIYFSHADCPDEEVAMIQDMLKEAFPKSEIITGYIGPIVGACVGPNAIAIFAYGDEITYRVDAKS